MADIWGNVRQTVGNWADSLGTAAGLPETGWSEKIAGGPTTNTKLGGAGIAKASEPVQNSSQMIPASGVGSQYMGQPVKPSAPAAPVDNSRLAQLQAQKNSGQLSGSAEMEYNDLIKNSQNTQQDSAQSAAEARRKAAESKYNAMVGIANNAKETAKGEYDWLTETLGSNKKDSLEQIALNQSQGEADYATQEKKTRTDYDSAKQQILTTYRDLQTQQEKILRGSGMSSSSRSQEAALKLNSLLGKDLSTVTTNEADSLASIGNALTNFQKQVALTKNSIETETKSKLDKAALDYNSQVKSIDANLTLSAAEREDAYAQAETQLAADSQGIEQWAAGLKIQASQLQAKNQETIDSFVDTMLDANGALNSSLDEKRVMTNDVITKSGFTALDVNSSNASNPTSGVYQNSASYSTKDALDKALAEGKVSQQEYQAQLSNIQLNSGSGGSIADKPVTSIASATINPRSGMTTQQDPLLSALFA